MSERQGDTAKFRQELDKHITRSDEPAPMSNRISKAQVARLRELERQAGDHVNLMLFRASRDLLPALLDTLDEAMTALGVTLEDCAGCDGDGKWIADGKETPCGRCKRARALLADYGL